MYMCTACSLGQARKKEILKMLECQQNPPWPSQFILIVQESRSLSPHMIVQYFNIYINLSCYSKFLIGNVTIIFVTCS